MEETRLTQQQKKNVKRQIKKYWPVSSGPFSLPIPSIKK